MLPAEFRLTLAAPSCCLLDKRGVYAVPCVWMGEGREGVEVLWAVRSPEKGIYRYKSILKFKKRKKSPHETFQLEKSAVAGEKMESLLLFTACLKSRRHCFRNDWEFLRVVNFKELERHNNRLWGQRRSAKRTAVVFSCKKGFKKRSLNLFPSRSQPRGENESPGSIGNGSKVLGYMHLG